MEEQEQLGELGCLAGFELGVLRGVVVENLDLERVVETARRLKRYEFMITFAPLPVEGGTGSPVNPVATLFAMGVLTIASAGVPYASWEPSPGAWRAGL